MKSKNFFLLILFFLFPLFFSACFFLPPIKEKPFFFTSKDKSPKRVVILPFSNRTQKKEIEVKMRKSFYNHFSSKNYYDIELYEVDNSIKSLEKFYEKPWSELPASEIGKFFNADFIIYGEVNVFRRIFLLLYSQMTLSVEVKMVDAVSGQAVFSEVVVRSLVSGDIPINPFSIFSATVRSGLNIKEKRVIVLADKVSRAFAEKIPEPQYPPGKSFCVDVQVASFSKKDRALRIVKEFSEKGVGLRIEKVMLKGMVWYRVLAGPYIQKEAEKTREMIVSASAFSPILIHH